MRITRLYLRNYRVFEDPIELELPPGLVGIYGPNGGGKCLPEGTRVWDAESGEGIPIERFVREQREYMLGYVEGKISRVSVKDWHELGTKPTVAVTLANGARIEVAPTHPLLTDRGCVPAGELTSNDWVAEARRIPAVSPPLVTNDEAMLLGMLLGDGCMTKTVSFTAFDPEVARTFRDLVHTVFPHCTVRSSARHTHLIVSRLAASDRIERRRAFARRLLGLGIPLQAYVGANNVARLLRGAAGPSWETMEAIENDYGLDLWEDRCALHGGRAVIEWIRAFGLLGHNARSKRVPPSLLLLPEEQAASLLAGLWMTDGYVADVEKVLASGWHTAEISYTTASSGLADDVRVLLLRLGLTSTHRRRTVRGAAFHAVALTAASQRRFGCLVPLVGRKAEHARGLAEWRGSAVAHPSHDRIPPSFNRNLRTRSASGRERTRKQIALHAMSREVFLDFGGDPRVAEADSSWSRVVSVEPTGRSVPCFDVTVDSPEHLYLAETFIVHNSTLVEAIRFSLYGRSRTANDEVRTSGVKADCVAEVEFEHEGHLYLVRRVISGAGSAVRASAHADRQQVAEGARDVTRYVHSVLGMEDAAFRASVFAEQKQLAAFSQQSPHERRRLVLQLLGITPLDAARDQARKDARGAQERFEQLRSMLPDLERLREDGARSEDAAAEKEKTAAAAEQAAIAVRAELQEASRRHDEIDGLRQEHELLAAEAKGVRAERDRTAQSVAKLETEVAELARAAAQLAELAPEAEGWQEAEAHLRLVEAVVGARLAVEGAVVPPIPPVLDEEGCEAARAEAEEARAELAEASGRLQAARAERDRAIQASTKSSQLTGEGACPLCGQALGEAFAEVQAHRQAELAEAETRMSVLETATSRLSVEATQAADEARARSRGLKDVRVGWEAYEKALDARDRVVATLTEAEAALGRPVTAEERTALAADVERRRRAADECHRIRGRLERRDTATTELDVERAFLAEHAGRIANLVEKIAGIGFSPDDLAAAREARHWLRLAAEEAATAVQAAAMVAAEGRARAEGDARRLADAEEQHRRLDGLREDARHLGRLAEMLNAFRNTQIATVGPRLSTHAADLFAELTDNEYDRLEVDPQTYEIKVRDGGLLYGMNRFSGSETDLANLALRVAISEHVRFQSGGAVGLLVLDEVFGPLDDDRKERMLLALERLRARFRQVLVVTHDTSVKHQLPNAVEVIKLPGRRATARVGAGVPD